MSRHHGPAVALLFLALTFLFQPTLVLNVNHAFPMLRHAHIHRPFKEDVPTDTLLLMGILAHDVHTLTHHPSRLFDWPIFHPHRKVLAYTDHLLAQAILSLPLWAVTHNVALIHNLLLLASFVACGMGSWLLVRHLTGSSGAGIISGIVFAFWPQRSHDIDHIHLLWSFWMPLALWALHRWCETGRRRYAIGFALLAAAQGLSSLYLGLYFLTLAVPFAFYAVAKRGIWRRRRTWTDGLLAAALAFGLLLPPALPYLAVRSEMGFVRSIEEAQRFSIGLAYYLKPYPGTYLWKLFANNLAPEGTGHLLGIIPLGLALLGASAAWLRKSGGGAWQSWVAPYLVWTVAAVILSGGPRLRLDASLSSPSFPGPFGWLFQHLIAFQGTRAPSRFSYIAVLGLSVLAGFGAVRLAGQLRHSLAKHVIITLAALACFLEPRTVPPDLYRDRIPSAYPRVYQWLERQDSREAVFEMPADPFTNDAIYTYFAGFHHHPIINGNSGYIPPATLFFEERMQRFPAPDALRLLEEVGVRFVIIHDPNWRPPPQLASHLPPEVYRDDQARVYSIQRTGIPPPTPPTHRPRPIWGGMAKSNVPASHPERAIDRDLGSAWNVQRSATRSDQPAYLEIDLGRERSILGVVVRSGPSPSTSLWSSQIDVSRDGITFHRVAQELQPSSIAVFVSTPPEADFQATFPTEQVRVLRISNPGFWAERWSVAEVGLLPAPATGTTGNPDR